jgi:hypothetical protein
LVLHGLVAGVTSPAEAKLFCMSLCPTVGYNYIFIGHKALLPMGETAVAQNSLPISPSAKVEFTTTHTLQGVFLMLD